MSHNVSQENFSQAKTYTCCIKIDPESITMFKWIHAVFYNLFQFASLFHATNTIPNYFQHVFIRRSYFRLCDSDQIFPLKVCVFANVKFSFTLLSRISYIRTVMFVFLLTEVWNLQRGDSIEELKEQLQQINSSMSPRSQCKFVHFCFQSVFFSSFLYIETKKIKLTFF